MNVVALNEPSEGLLKHLFLYLREVQQQFISLCVIHARVNCEHE